MTFLALQLFDVAYARRSSLQDGLSIALSTDCGNTFACENMLYHKIGSSLATIAGSTSQAWYPTEANQWREEVINLSTYIGQEAIRFAFIGLNAGGNNIFLDNVRVVFRKETIEEEVNGYRDLANALQIYPNPNDGKFNILFHVYEPKDVQVRIFNVIGQEVFFHSLSQAQETYTIDLSALPAGMYLVNAISGQEKVTKKVVIAK